MSDGPHRSLPMRLGWRNLAQFGDNQAFTAEELRRAIIPALEQDCKCEIPPDFVEGVSTMFREHESSLFKDQIGPQLESLRASAGCGIGRVILDHAIYIAEGGGTGMDGLLAATMSALTDRASRGARQVEEHYCRKASAPRAQKVRARIEAAIGGADIKGLARQILKLEPRSSARQSLRQHGLDDGVRL